jgi:thiamine biosynthesis lipoprotein
MNVFQRRVAGLSLVLATLSTPAFLPHRASQLYISDYENVLGTSFEMKVAAASAQPAAQAETAALREVDRLNKILSGYDANSEFSRWLRAGQKPVAVSAELYEVLDLFEQWRLKSDGALDASAETVSQLWREAAKQNRQPTEAEIAAAVAAVHQQHYVLNAQNHTAQRLSTAPLVLNSFAKSYILNKAAGAALATPGVRGVVLNIGGDILVRGEHSEQINVSNPRADAENDLPVAQLQVSDKTIATSGDYRRGETIGGRWYSHIIDPRTGRPASEVISATVVADKATDAGALATALNVLPPAEGQALVAAVPGAEFMLLTADGQRLESAGWQKLERPAAPAVTKAPAPLTKDKPWDPNYEVALSLELVTPEGGGRVHRPFVAVWVVDSKKKPVRQLALWYNKPRWLHDMSAWYATYNDQFAAGNNSISSTTSATRPAGKYTLKWDGKDDQGNPVPQGSYTLMVEVAREHGTHQLMKQEIVGKKPQHFDLPANEEVASAAVDYRKKTDGQ